MTSFLDAFFPFLTCSADLREILARIAVVCRLDDFFLILTISTTNSPTGKDERDKDGKKVWATNFTEKVATQLEFVCEVGKVISRWERKAGTAEREEWRGIPVPACRKRN